jgi:hypothetical protein
MLSTPPIVCANQATLEIIIIIIIIIFFFFFFFFFYLIAPSNIINWELIFSFTPSHFISLIPS